jgi:hypothetical protein
MQEIHEIRVIHALSSVRRTCSLPSKMVNLTSLWGVQLRLTEQMRTRTYILLSSYNSSSTHTCSPPSKMETLQALASTAPSTNVLPYLHNSYFLQSLI